jgi:ERCC4-type nuclease
MPGWVILQDDREKKPLLFPDNLVRLDESHPPLCRRGTTERLLVKEKRLLTGDYQLQGYEDRCIIERKGALDEIATNLFDPHRRRKFVESLSRLRAECSLPVVLFEGTLKDALVPTRSNADPEVVVSALVSLLAEYRVTPIFLPSSSLDHRRATGRFVAWTLIQGALKWPPPPTASPNGTSPPTT